MYSGLPISFSPLFSEGAFQFHRGRTDSLVPKGQFFGLACRECTLQYKVRDRSSAASHSLKYKATPIIEKRVEDNSLLHWSRLGQLISSLLYCNPQYPFIMATDDRRRDRSRSRERDAPSGFGAQQSMYPMHGNRPPAMPYGSIPNLPTLPAFATATVSRVKSSIKRKDRFVLNSFIPIGLLTLSVQFHILFFDIPWEIAFNRTHIWRPRKRLTGSCL